MRVKILLLVLLFGLLALLIPHYIFIKKDLKISLVKTLLSWNSIKKADSQTNILVLGIPGGNHEGPNLTDSITIANYNYSKNKLTTIGIPRDIWTDSLEDKINTAYAYGEAKKRGSGLVLAKAEVAKFTGIPIQYAAVIDFNEFEDLIDFLGGVEIDVQEGFTDKKFPIEGKENDECGGDPEFECRYETIIFQKGKTVMNGEKALKFVRSRNAEGNQGNDFARSQRQQAVLSAVKSKVIRQLLRFSVGKNRQLYNLVNDSVERDITNQQAAILAKNLVFKGKLKQESTALSQDLFEVPPVYEYGKYVLVGRDGTGIEIQNQMKCLLEKGTKECPVKE